MDVAMGSASGCPIHGDGGVRAFEDNAFENNEKPSLRVAACRRSSISSP